MKYRVIRNTDNSIVADVTALEPLRIGNFTAPPGWVARQGAVIEGHTIEPYEPAPPPPPPAPTIWTVPWLVFLMRLTDANANAARVYVQQLNAKIGERLMREGFAIDTGSPSQLETELRTWLTNNGEDPDLILALP